MARGIIRSLFVFIITAYTWNIYPATVQEVFGGLPTNTVSATAQLGGTGGIETNAPQVAFATLKDGSAIAWGSANQIQAFAFASDDGSSPRANASATGGGYYVIGDSAGQAVDFTGNLVARFDLWVIVNAGDKPSGPGSLHGFAEANFDSTSISGGLDLATHITTPDKLTIKGVLAGLVGNNQTNEDGVSQENFGSYAQASSITNGIGQIQFTTTAYGFDATNTAGDDMPGPAFAISGMGFAGFEQAAGSPLPDGAMVYFASGEALPISDPDLGTTPIDLPNNPFPNPPIPEPTSGSLLALGCFALTHRRRGLYARRSTP